MADPSRTWTEELEIAGNELVDCVQSLVREGNVRRVILRDAAGTVLFELPLAAGVAMGGVVALALPTLAGLGAIAALVTNCRLEVVRAQADEAPADPADPAGPVPMDPDTDEPIRA